MRAVNLLPRETTPTGLSRPRLPLLVGGCGAVLISAVLAASYMTQSGKISTERQNLDSLQARVSALPPEPAGPSTGATQLAGEHSARLAALTTALGSRVTWDRVFREFSLVLPNDVWLTGLQVHSPVSPATNLSAASGGGPTMFVIQGRTYSHDGVARLLSRLQVVPDLTNVQLASSSLTRLNGQQVVEFAIAADIKAGSGGS